MPIRIAPLPDLPGEVPEWHERGLCREVGGDEFFPVIGSNGAAAKRICGRCEVKEICRQDALDRREPYGIWGGLTEYDRERLWAAEAA